MNLAPQAADAQRILVADDETLMRTTLQRLLQARGYEVEMAYDGLDALNKLRSNSYDLLLLDLMMPRLTGHGVMDQIKEAQLDVQVIVVSGDTAIDSAISALRRGAYDFVRKPYEPDEILQRVQNALASRRLRIENQSMAKRLRQSEQWHRYLVNHSPDIIYTLDTQGRFTYVNRTVERLLGFNKRDLLGQHYSALVHEEDLAGAGYRVDERRTGERATRSFELRLKRHTGERMRYLERHVPVELSAVGMYDGEVEGQKRHLGSYGVARDVSDRKRAEQNIAFQAYHDLLTGLPNRALFQDRLTQAIHQAKRDHTQLAVMFIDLDKFKFVNDSLGHVAGDKLLKAIAARMRACLREVDTLARMGGDEFVLILPHIKEAADATLIAEKILLALQQKFTIGDHELFASVSIGIAVYPSDADTYESLVKRADAAMYHAKGQGRNNYQLFDAAMDAQASDRLTLVRELRDALDRGEFELYYHPQLDVRSHRIVGMEALLRWNHPTQGLLTPGTFIHLAEEIGIVCAVGEWVLRTVCRHAREWRAAGLPTLRLAVNLSAVQIQRPHFQEKFLEVLAEHEIDPEQLCIEITESTIMKDIEASMPNLNRLVSAGVEIALDDFGTGYSSLSYLNRLPIHTLKIDQSFVRDLPDNPGHLSIVRAIATMAEGLALRVVIEGVETTAQRDALVELGCHEHQGFLFSRPLPHAAATALLNNQKTNRGSAIPAP